jgi:hypothetical protein
MHHKIFHIVKVFKRKSQCTNMASVDWVAMWSGPSFGSRMDDYDGMMLDI